MSVLRVPMYRPTLEGLAHSPGADMAVEVAFILFICSNALGWPDLFPVYYFNFVYFFSSLFIIHFEHISNIYLLFLITFLVMGWWVEGIRHVGKSDHGENQSMTNVNHIDRPQASNQ